MQSISILDSSLRDGCQAEGVSFSVNDKLEIVKTLDQIGVSYIEAGYPSSNPKDITFFEKCKRLQLTSKLTAFGATRRKNTTVQSDPAVLCLLEAQTPVVALFGKSSLTHVTHILGTTPAENLLMIEDTIRFFKQNNREVLFDAEHFFDGYKIDAAYAMQTLSAAAQAGADVLVLCDTNGGSFYDEIYTVTKRVVERFPQVQIGIHCHNDNGVAVANTMSAVKAGAVHVQGTMLGFGERCGNTNLSTLIPNLQLKRGFLVIPNASMQDLTVNCARIASIANIKVASDLPYVGKSAFAHKAGMHADGVTKESASFEHIAPALVGNRRRFPISEMAGRSGILSRIQKLLPQLSLTRDSDELSAVISRLKEMESEGYQLESADATFELLVRKELQLYVPFFKLLNYTIICEHPDLSNTSDCATIKVEVDGEIEITAAEGNGPVNALDGALRKALCRFYPELLEVSLVDYKVRVLEEQAATEAIVRVLIDSTDGTNFWTTVGVSTDIIAASWIALADSMEYKLSQRETQREAKR